MHPFSTNCLYYAVYITLANMAHELNTPLNKSWAINAEKLRSAINREFWNPESQSYRYLVDPNGNSEH